MPFLTTEPIDARGLEATVRADDLGAVVTFLGQVRNLHEGRMVTALEYSAYGPMAERVCGEIVRGAESRWPVRIALVHRVGALRIGDDAVAIVAAGAHRAEAFEACRWVIEEVKRLVPIWKREQYADGSEAWVDPTAPTGTRPAERP